MKKSLQKLLLFLPVLCLLALPSMAQTSMDPNMPMATNILPQIKGAETPEQIPVRLAYRLWALHNVVNGKVNQDGITPIRLAPSDEATVKGLILDLSAQINFAAGKYNEAVSYDAVNKTTNANQDAFRAEFEGIVGVSFTKLQITLSDEGFKRFTNYLELAKKGMEVSPFDSGLGSVAARNLMENKMIAGGASMPPGITLNYSTVFQQTVGFPAHTSAGDTFNRANGAPGSAWTIMYGNYTIYNNALKPTANGPNSYPATIRYNGTFSPNQSYTIKLASVPGSGSSAGVAVRMSSDGKSYYSAVFTPTAVYLIKMLNMNQSVLKSVTYSAQVGDSLSITAVGSELDVYLNSPTGIGWGGGTSAKGLMYAIDSSITSGNPGIVDAIPSPGSPATIDSFNGGHTFYTNLSASISGTTTCNGTCVGTAQHTGVTSVGIGSDVHTVDSNTVFYPSYLSANVANSFDIPTGGFLPGTPVTVTTKINCTLTVGPLQLNGGSGDGTNFYMPLWWAARTWTIATGPVGPITPTPTAINCTPETIPPDFNCCIDFYGVNFFLSPVFSNLAPCFRSFLPSNGYGSGSHFFCSIVGSSMADADEDPAPRNCTAGGGRLYPAMTAP